MTIVLEQITCYKCRKNADSIITNNSYSYYTPSTGAPHGLDLLQILPLLLLTTPFQRRHWQPTPVFLPGESQGLGSLVGCRL